MFKFHNTCLQNASIQIHSLSADFNFVSELLYSGTGTKFFVALTK
jgi:hypothetical protein